MSERQIADLHALATEPGWQDRVEIRPLQADELRALEWGGEYTHFRLIYEEVFARSQRGLALMWAAHLPGAGVIGQAFVQLSSRARPGLADGEQRAYVHSFRVRTPFRGSGLGNRMMDVLEADLRERGYRTVTLNVVRENQGALRFYKRRGYRVAGPDPGKWEYIDPDGVLHKVHEPGWRMEKRLVDRFGGWR